MDYSSDRYLSLCCVCGWWVCLFLCCCCLVCLLSLCCCCCLCVVVVAFLLLGEVGPNGFFRLLDGLGMQASAQSASCPSRCHVERTGPLVFCECFQVLQQLCDRVRVVVSQDHQRGHLPVLRVSIEEIHGVDHRYCRFDQFYE